MDFLNLISTMANFSLAFSEFIIAVASVVIAFKVSAIAANVQPRPKR